MFEIRNVKAQDEGQLTDTQRLQRGVDEINAQKDDLAEIRNLFRQVKLTKDQ